MWCIDYLLGFKETPKCIALLHAPLGGYLKLPAMRVVLD